MDPKFFIFFAFIVGCNASYFFDLMKEFNVDTSSPPPDATVVNGPNGEGKAIVYSDAKPIYLSGSTASYLIDSLMNSDDFTYYTWLKTPAKMLEKDKEWMFFTLQSKLKAKPVYFGVGLSFLSKTGQGSEDVTKDKVYTQYITLKQYTSYDLNTKSQNFQVKEEFKPNTWYQLMLRIKVADKTRRRKRRSTGVTVNVRVNCKSIGVFELPDGKFGDGYRPTGYAVLGSSLAFTNQETPTIKNHFPGALAKSQIINGKDAFTFYSPCDADFSVQDIPSEPLPSDYSDEKWKLFQKLSSSVKTSSITCPGTTPTRYNGEIWVENSCEKFQCLDGKVTEEWICEEQLCEDKVTGKKYKQFEKWVDSVNVCKEYECVLGFHRKLEKTITCQNVTVMSCPGGYAPIKLATECCHKCPSDTCSTGRQYYEGCKRTCADGPDFVCPQKKVGCWCPLNYAENKDGDCISINKCPCVSGNVIYQPGQTAVRSSCETCVCVNGGMRCFERC